MKVGFQYFSDSNKALEYVGKRIDNGSELEVIAAECVTCKKDFEARAKMRPDIVLNMMVFTVTFGNEDEDDIYRERYEMLLDWMNELAQCGARFDQFVITCHETDTGNHEYHIIASLIDQGGYNVDTRDLNGLVGEASAIFSQMNDLCEQTCVVKDYELNLPHSLPNIQCKNLRYGSCNPLCHELVLPFRDGILASLKKSLFYC